MTTAVHYYEAHVTTDPVGDRTEEFKQTCEFYCFHPAHLLMDKGGRLLPSDIDNFCTGRDRDLDVITDRVATLVVMLRLKGFVVRRYKIEDTVLDSRIKDELHLLAT